MDSPPGGKESPQDMEESITFDIPGLDALAHDSTLPSSATAPDVPPSDKSDDFDSITEAFQAAISEECSSLGKPSSGADLLMNSRSIFDEDSTNKFGELESKISDILSDMCKSPQPKDDIAMELPSEGNTTESPPGDKVTQSKKQPPTSDEKLEDLEDESMDNDGDTLGLLAEDEGRERHSSDDEDEEADVEAEEEHLDSELEESDAILDEGESNDFDGETDDLKSGEDEDEEETSDESSQVKCSSKLSEELQDELQFSMDVDSNDGIESQPLTFSDVLGLKGVNAGEVVHSDEDTNASSDLNKDDDLSFSICNITSLATNVQDVDSASSDIGVVKNTSSKIDQETCEMITLGGADEETSVETSQIVLSDVDKQSFSKISDKIQDVSPLQENDLVENRSDSLTTPPTVNEDVSMSEFEDKLLDFQSIQSKELPIASDDTPGSSDTETSSKVQPQPMDIDEEEKLKAEIMNEDENLKDNDDEELENEESKKLAGNEFKKLKDEEFKDLKYNECEEQKLNEKESERLKDDEHEKLTEKESENLKDYEIEKLNDNLCKNLKVNEQANLEDKESENLKDYEVNDKREKKLGSKNSKNLKDDKHEKLDKESEKLKDDKHEKLDKESEKLKDDKHEKLDKESEKLKDDKHEKLDKESEKLKDDEREKLDNESEKLKDDEQEKLEDKDSKKVNDKQEEKLKGKVSKNLKDDKHEKLDDKESEKLKDDEQEKLEDTDSKKVNDKQEEKLKGKVSKNLKDDEHEKLDDKESEKLKDDKQEKHEDVESEKVEDDEHEKLEYKKVKNDEQVKFEDKDSKKLKENEHENREDNLSENQKNDEHEKLEDKKDEKLEDKKSQKIKDDEHKLKGKDSQILIDNELQNRECEKLENKNDEVLITEDKPPEFEEKVTEVIPTEVVEKDESDIKKEVGVKDSPSKVKSIKMEMMAAPHKMEDKSQLTEKTLKKTGKKLPQIVSLDSDDESSIEKDEKQDHMRVKKSDKHTKRERCINPVCLKTSDLTPCPLFLSSIFRARDTANVPIACQKCLKKGISIMEQLSSKLRTGSSLLDIDFANYEDLVEISDSDSDDDSKINNRLVKGGWRKKGLPKPSVDELLNEDEQKYLDGVFPDAFVEVWNKLNVQGQIESCEDKLWYRVDSLEANCDELEKMIIQEQVQLDKIRKDLYEAFRYPTNCEEEVTITENGDYVVINPMAALPERRSLRLKKPVMARMVVPQQHQQQPQQLDIPELPPIHTADSVVVDVQKLTFHTDIMPSGGSPLVDFTLSVGFSVYAVRQSIFGAWCLASIVRVMPKGTKLANGTLSQFSLVTVRFTQGGEGEQVTKQVTGRQVAYALQSAYMFPVGTRIVALFQNKQQPKEAYYSGVIAEIPVKANNYRYLVFFDDGYCRYVYHKFIMLVCQRSVYAWEDVHPDSRNFIRKYLQSFPNQPMVRVEPGHTIRTEYKGKFVTSSVIAVDGSLALIKFLPYRGVPVNHEEWIYRGSTRLEPLFLELQAADRKLQGRQRASYAVTNPYKNKNFPYVEYSRFDQPEPQTPAITQLHQPQPSPVKIKELKETPTGPRAVAKKSTVMREDPNKNKEREEPPIGQQAYPDQVRSKVVYYSPKVSIKPKKFTPHRCGPNCLNKDAIALRELRTYNPLARPLLSGWQRLIIKYRGKRTIMYHAPCGRKLRNSRELHLYLRFTHSQMSVDLFDFDHWVHCLAEYVPTKCYVSKKDLSHGVEAVPVPCVNYYDHTLPEFSAYSTRRIPTRGVNLNLDEEFLCGCDCTDDCQDRSKCQCWQMTLEGASVVGAPLNRIGYQYKRLLEPVHTGIYECNSRCKCAATCLNRVVQHPLQLKLQVFKTFNRGWGIRALNDLSKGTFICIYAGNLLTDAVANVDGVTEGDEYLAELDYIEVVEKLKENYESDVPEEEKDFEDSESDSEEKKDGKDKKNAPHGESDDEFRPSMRIETNEGGIVTRRQLRKKKTDKNKSIENSAEISKQKEDEKDTKDKEKEPVKKAGVNQNDKEKCGNAEDDGEMPVDEFITISDDEEKREPSRFAAPDNLNDSDEYTPKRRCVRSSFGKDEACYIMDAKVQGNLGRYLNHSCCPNVFVQNVFVDTHDPRFPWVAFFTLNHVRAGTELTWNYNYDVGSVPGKVIFCKCGAVNCRGRLL